MIVDAFWLVSRLYVGLIWCLAGAGKLAEQPVDSAFVRHLPKQRAQRAVVLGSVTAAEVTVGLLMLGGRLFPIVPGVSVMLLVAFVVLRLAGRIKGDCGCMGGLRRDGALRVQQVAMWAALSIWVMVGTRWARAWEMPPVPSIILVCAAVAISFGIVFQHELRKPEQATAAIRQLVNAIRTHRQMVSSPSIAGDDKAPPQAR